MQSAPKPKRNYMRWSEQDLDYLERTWGEKTIPSIARELGRTVIAVQIKANRLGYPAQTEGGELMTISAVAEMMGVSCDMVRNWVAKYGLHARRRALLLKAKTTIVRFSELLAWLEANPERWDSRRVPMYGLGVEYDWLRKKRAIDAQKRTVWYERWTAAEDERLRALLRRGMTHAQSAQELGRTVSAVRNHVQKAQLGKRRTRDGNQRGTPTPQSSSARMTAPLTQGSLGRETGDANGSQDPAGTKGRRSC